MRLKRHLLPAAGLAALALAFIVVPVLAAGDFGLSDAVKGTSIPTGRSIPTIIATILRVVTGFVGTIFLLLMIYAGVLWMTARGDSKKVDTAKQLITSAIIGVLIISSAYAITSLVIAAASGDTSVVESDADVDEGEIEISTFCTDDSDCEAGKTCGAADADGDRFCE